jgi:hypothetical protein
MIDKDEINRLFIIYNHKGFNGILEEFQQKDKVIEILKGACEFYADYQNYYEDYDVGGSIVSKEDDRDYIMVKLGSIEESQYSAGKLARQALAQIEDLTQKEKE